MNSVNLIGRLTKDIDLRYTQGQEQLAVVRFTIAVNRIGKDNEADFISCVVFGKQAENMERYVGKGSQIGVTGSIKTGSYENNQGNRVYTTDVIVNRVEFLSFKDDKKQDGYTLPDGFSSIEDEEDLPF